MMANRAARHGEKAGREVGGQTRAGNEAADEKRQRPARVNFAFASSPYFPGSATRRSQRLCKSGLPMTARGGVEPEIAEPDAEEATEKSERPRDRPTEDEERRTKPWPRLPRRSSAG